MPAPAAAMLSSSSENPSHFSTSRIRSMSRKSHRSLTLVPEEEDLPSPPPSPPLSLSRHDHSVLRDDDSEDDATYVDDAPVSVSTTSSIVSAAPGSDQAQSLFSFDAFSPPPLILDRGRHSATDQTDRQQQSLITAPKNAGNSPRTVQNPRTPFSPARPPFTSTPATSPDRFIPTRGAYPLDTSAFRITKNPRHLSPNERRFRHRDPQSDPFLSPSRNRARSLPPPNATVSEFLHPGSFPHALPRFVTDEDASTASRLHAGDDGDGATRSALGQPAVWRLEGGASPRNFSPLRVEDGSGGLISSGVGAGGAPMFVADFLKRRSPAECKLRHEARIAAALGIDQAERMVRVG
ncbi:hypothetical protein KEM55_002550, partial [Ascosphaera atra]